MIIEDFRIDLMLNHNLYTNILVLDEAIYVSKRKYDLDYSDIIEFIDKAVTLYVNIVPIGLNEHVKARDIMRRYGLKHLDAINAATIINNGLKAIASGDEDFDKIGIRRA